MVTRLIQRIISGVSGGHLPKNETTNTATSRPMFDDRRKKMNFWMFR